MLSREFFIFALLAALPTGLLSHSINHTPDSALAQTSENPWSNSVEVKQINQAIENPASINYALLGNEKLAIYFEADQTIKIFNLTSGEQIRTIVLDTKIFDMAAPPDGSTLATVSDNGNVRLWNSDTGSEIGLFEEASSSTYNFSSLGFLSFSAYGQYLAFRTFTFGAPSALYIWNFQSKQLMLKYNVPLGSFLDWRFSPDEKVIAIQREDNKIEFWNLSTGQVAFSLSNDRTMSSGFRQIYFYFSPDGRFLVTNTRSFFEDSYHSLMLWELDTKTVIKTFDYGDRNLILLAFTENDQIIYGSALESDSTGFERGYGVWNWRTGETRLFEEGSVLGLGGLGSSSSSAEEPGLFRLPSFPPTSATVSPDARTVVGSFGNKDKEYFVFFDLPTGQIIRDSAGNIRSINCNSSGLFSQDGRTFICQADSSIRVVRQVR